LFGSRLRRAKGQGHRKPSELAMSQMGAPGCDRLRSRNSRSSLYLQKPRRCYAWRPTSTKGKYIQGCSSVTDSLHQIYRRDRANHYNIHTPRARSKPGWPEPGSLTLGRTRFGFRSQSHSGSGLRWRMTRRQGVCRIDRNKPQHASGKLWRMNKLGCPPPVIFCHGPTGQNAAGSQVRKSRPRTPGTWIHVGI
jgi:hypothetical protein